MLYVRREGANARVADSLAYRFVPGGFDAWNQRFGLVIRDRDARDAARAELERMCRESPWCGWAESQLGAIAYLDGDRGGARRHLESAIRLDPRLPAVHRQLGYLDLADGRPRDAITAFNAELALHTTPLDLYRRMGEAHEAIGDRDRAIQWYRRAVANGPDAAAAAALDRLQAKPAP
jgi:tetratricopeptide (TPR) repeat protein